MRRKLLLSGILLVFLSCNPAEKDQKNTLTYFDIKGYFEKEVLRLARINPLVTKTVAVNELPETKQIRITDWTKELSAFSDADINRSAWRGLFNKKSTGQEEVYSSDDKKVPVKELTITKRNGQVYGIRILIRYSNVLYSSADTLSYFPDSLYQVKKKQQIKLLDEKNYSITGRFK